ncbi:hypothetical protein BB558_005161 [Smittium angustum]|uniref:Uncharacterized protein n=1 Tax=Smittium angustum TaxID=133377 RepID=A0A2U1IYA1_SMIAN|nr:hypothetical protein BB558_006220 [Smittium angustum]PVZ98825.1 hypothetical protein BB558_005161 [Smittium angustum]
MDNLSYEILSLIFIWSRNPNLALVSRSFYEVSKSVTVQANTLIGIFGKRRDIESSRMLKKYPKLAMKRKLYIALLRKGLFLDQNLPLYERPFALGWIDVINQMLQQTKLVEVSEAERVENLDQKTSEQQELYIIEPYYKIGAEEYRCVVDSKPKNYIKVLKLLDDAHKIQINAAKEHNILSTMIVGKSAIVTPHEKINYKVDRGYRYPVYFYGNSRESIFPPEFYEGVVSTNLKLFFESLSKEKLQDSFATAIRIQNRKMIDFILSHSNLVQLASNQSFHEAIKTGNMKIINDHMRNKHLIQYTSTDILNYEGIKNVQVLDLGLRSTIQDEKRMLELFQQFSKENKMDFLKCLLDFGLDRNRIKEEYIKNGEYLNFTLPFEIILFFYNNGLDFLHLNGKAISLASEIGDIKMAEFLTKKGAETCYGITCLIRSAISTNNIEMARVLLLNDSKFHMCIRADFRFACLKGNNEIAAIMLEKRKDIHKTIPNLLLSVYSRGNMDVCNLLIKSGADINEGNGKLLKMAIQKNDSVMIGQLAELGAVLDLSDKKSIFNATEYGYTNLVEKAIKCGLVSNTETMNSCLILSIKNNHYDIFCLLLKNNADPLYQKNSPIVFACGVGNMDMVKILISMGANIRAKSDKGFVQACKSGHYEIAKLAIEHGADVSAGSYRGEALKCAYLGGYQEIVDLLIENGADKNFILNGKLLEDYNNQDNCKKNEDIN